MKSAAADIAVAGERRRMKRTIACLLMRPVSKTGDKHPVWRCSRTTASSGLPRFPSAMLGACRRRRSCTTGSRSCATSDRSAPTRPGRSSTFTRTHSATARRLMSVQGMHERRSTGGRGECDDAVQWRLRRCGRSLLSSRRFPTARGTSPPRASLVWRSSLLTTVTRTLSAPCIASTTWPGCRSRSVIAAEALPLFSHRPHAAIR